MKNSKQQGMALLVVILLLSVMSLLAVQMTQRYRLMWQYSANHLDFQKQRWYLLGAESLLSRVLSQGFRDEPAKTTLAQYWATERRSIPIDEATLVGVVKDLQACFNVNSLSGRDEIKPSAAALYREQVFIRLLVALDVDEYRARHITSSVEDWIDSNSIEQRYGAEDNDYLAMSPPYLPANQLMQDVSELRLIKHMDTSLYQRLLPFVCALPVRTLQININTVLPSQAKLLSSLFFDTISEQEAARVIASRPYEGWDSVADFLEQSAFGGSESTFNSFRRSLTIQSFYFESRLQLSASNSRAVLKTLFHRRGNNNAVVISRHYGGAF